MKLVNPRLAALSRRLDPIWWLLARLLVLPRGKSNQPPRSILLVDLHLLGDIVMLVPLLRVLRRCQPQAHLGLVAGPWAQDLLRDTGLVDEYLPLQAFWVRRGPRLAGLRAVWQTIARCRTREWDWGIDVRGDVRNILILALARAQRRIAYDFTGGAALLTDVVPDDGQLRHIIEHHRELVRYLGMEMLAQEAIPILPRLNSPILPGGRQIGFHFGASMPLRRMPVGAAVALITPYAALADVRVVMIDTPDTEVLNSSVIAHLDEDSVARVQRWCGSLEELMKLLCGLERFYAMDSGPAHIAAALGVNTTVFFGPNLPVAVRPFGAQVRIAEPADLYCRPCDHHNCVNARPQACLVEAVATLRSL